MNRNRKSKHESAITPGSHHRGFLVTGPTHYATDPDDPERRVTLVPVQCLSCGESKAVRPADLVVKTSCACRKGHRAISREQRRRMHEARAIRRAHRLARIRAAQEPHDGLPSESSVFQTNHCRRCLNGGYRPSPAGPRCNLCDHDPGDREPARPEVIQHPERMVTGR